MARITVEDCLTKERNRFALVQLASKRAKQLLHGSRPSVLDNRGNKSVVMALREIAAGQVRFMTEDEKRIAREQAQREREARAAEQAAAAAAAAPAEVLRGPDSIMKSPAEASEVAETNGLNGENL